MAKPREVKRIEAAERNLEWSSMSPREQLRSLDRRDLRALRQRGKLIKAIKGEQQMIRMTQLKSKAESHKVAEFVAMKEHTEVQLRSFDGRNMGSYAPTGVFEEPMAPSLSATLAVMLMAKVSGLRFLARTYQVRA